MKSYFDRKFHYMGNFNEYDDKLITIPNVLSVLRLIGLPFLIWFLKDFNEFGPAPACILGGFMLVSDILDGTIARYFNQITKIGAIMDPVIDKLVIDSLAITLVFFGWLPLWSIVIIILRDLAILIFGLRALLEANTLVTPVFVARLVPLSWAATFFAAIAEVEIAKWILISVSSLLTLLSGIIYYNRYKYLIKNKEDF